MADGLGIAVSDAGRHRRPQRLYLKHEMTLKSRGPIPSYYEFL